MKKSFNPNIFVPFIDVIKQFYDVKFDEFKKIDISLVHIQLLHFLIDHEGCNQQTIADVRDVKRSTVSVELDKMEASNLILREKSELDKRMVNIFLTEKGRNIGEYIRDEYEKYCWSYMEDFTSEEVEVFSNCIERFIKKDKDNKQKKSN